MFAGTPCDVLRYTQSNLRRPEMACIPSIYLGFGFYRGFRSSLLPGSASISPAGSRKKRTIKLF